jgi:ribosomal protein S18 acetylase RimI-like enzyme
MIPLTITSIGDERLLRMAREFMLNQPQFYPSHREWVDGKCVPRIEEGRYRSLAALHRGSVIGVAIYEILPGGKIEIKNFRIDRTYQRRDLGHFLLTQAEVESGCSSVGLDVTVNNFPAVQFFIRNGFEIRNICELYLPGQLEYVMEKTVAASRIPKP